MLRALPGDEHFIVGGVGIDRRGQAGVLLVGEVLRSGAEDGLDAVERVALAAAVSEGVLLDAASDWSAAMFSDCPQPECDDFYAANVSGP